MSLQTTTMAEKILGAHRVARHPTGTELIHVDRIYMDESAHVCMAQLRERGIGVPNPASKYLMVSHLAPVFDRQKGPTDTEIIDIFKRLEEFVEAFGVDLLRYDDPRQGIYHVVAPEQGITLPGMVVAGTDSHMTTHGGIGALGVSVGYDDATHILTNDSIWLRPPDSLLVAVDGTLGFGVSAKDLALFVVSELGAKGALGACVEFAGSTIRSLEVAGRMTLCNLMLEAGARGALVAIDDKTLDYVRGRPFSPKGETWDLAETFWRSLSSGEDANYCNRVSIDASDVAPMVSWGTTPDHVAPVTESVPELNAFGTDTDRRQAEAALDYMGLAPGTRLEYIPVDEIFIGSCTNGRIEDLRAAAAVLRGNQVVVPGLVVAGSTPVQRQAEAEGLDRVFIDSGLRWGSAGCAMCFGHHDMIVSPGRRCASTTNRSFPGRQGPGARTHLMSPQMAAAAALTGRIVDLRKLRR